MDSHRTFHAIYSHEGPLLPLGTIPWPRTRSGAEGARGWEKTGDTLPVWDGNEEKIILNTNSNSDGREQGLTLVGAGKEGQPESGKTEPPAHHPQPPQPGRQLCSRPAHPPRAGLLQGFPQWAPRPWGHQGSAGALRLSCRLHLL